MTNNFRCPVPTPINDEPTKKTLKRLEKELGANGSSVETDLGGDDHGYLGLILTDSEYAQIVHTAFVAPVFPGVLHIDPLATIVESVNLKESHKENTRIFRECRNVEKALPRHI